LNLSINAELVDELAAYAVYARTGMTAIVERAIWEYLQANRPKLGAPRDTKVHLDVPFPRYVSDENDIDDDEGTILHLYEELTANPIRDSDRQFLEEVRQYGGKTIATALFIGRGRYTKKINSLRFFHNNILEVAAWEPNKIDKELGYQMDMLRKKKRRN